MTYKEIRKNEEVLAFIKKGNENLGAMGFTDHSEASGYGYKAEDQCGKKSYQPESADRSEDLQHV